MGDQISSWLPQDILSVSNTEETGQERYMDAEGAATHLAEQTLIWEKKKMKQKGKLENNVLAPIFVFSVLPFLSLSLKFMAWHGA